jgi:hypothetical protein
LFCFLRQSHRDAVDQAVDMFEKPLTRTQSRAEHELDNQMRGQRQTIKAALATLRFLGAMILGDTVSDAAMLEHVSPSEWDNVILYRNTSWTVIGSADSGT